MRAFVFGGKDSVPAVSAGAGASGASATAPATPRVENSWPTDSGGTAADGACPNADGLDGRQAEEHCKEEEVGQCHVPQGQTIGAACRAGAAALAATWAAEAAACCATAKARLCTIPASTNTWPWSAMGS